jgi:subtilisin family serine protease
MKRALVIAIMMTMVLGYSIQAHPDPKGYRGGEVIIKLKSSRSVESMAGDLAAIDFKPIELLSRRLNIWLVTFDENRASDEAAIELVRAHDDVLLAQFNHYVTQRMAFPNDPGFANQWALHNTGQTGGTSDADIDAPEAWYINEGGMTALGDEVVIAVVDGGADINHSDIEFWKNTLDTPDNRIDDDGNGYIDDYDGWNAYNDNGNIPTDNHGTHVSGIAAAKGNNGLGVSGVNWGAKVMPIAGSSSVESTVVKAYDYVLTMRALYNSTDGAEGAFVVATNSSFGIDYGDPADSPIWCGMYDSMGAEGILSAAATANININIDVVGDVPTACPSDYMISVTNTTYDDTKNSGAAYGLTTIDLGAPGTNIYSTYSGNSYGNMTGTSMATPHVAGAVALQVSAAPVDLLQQYDANPGDTALTFKNNLLNSVDPLPSLAGRTVTGGRLNVHEMLLSLGMEDSDGDGVGDESDNCTEVANPDQRDTNSGEDDNTSVAGEQHYGNICDPDFNNDGIVDKLDKREMRKYIRQTVPPAPEDVDLDGDGLIGRNDVDILRSYKRNAPGPGIGD